MGHSHDMWRVAWHKWHCHTCDMSHLRCHTWHVIRDTSLWDAPHVTRVTCGMTCDMWRIYGLYIGQPWVIWVMYGLYWSCFGHVWAICGSCMDHIGGGSKMRTANCELANPKMRTGTRTAVRSLACSLTVVAPLSYADPISDQPTPLVPFIIMTVMNRIIKQSEVYCCNTM